MPQVTSDHAVAGIVEHCEAIWRMEKELDLFNRTVFDVHYWPLIRYPASSFLIQRFSNRRPEQPRSQRSTAEKIFRTLSTFVTDATALPWRVRSKFDAVLVPHARKHIRNGRFVEIASEGVVRDPNIGRLLILDWQGPRPDYNSVDRPEVRRRSIVAAIAQIRGRALIRKYFAQSKSEIAHLTSFFQREMGVNFPISAVSLARYISIFVETRALVREILKSSGAKRLFLTSGYGEPAYIAAARDLGMQSIELQYGMISRYHLGYSYPGRPPVPYTADRLLVFGKFWSDSVDLPQGMSTSVIGSSNLSYYRERRARRERRRVVVLSQGTIGLVLFKEAVQAASLAKEWHFIFRSHPGDRIEVYRQYLAALGDLAPVNFAISTANENTYELLANAEVQIGVYSTSVFEGMALGVRTIVLALSGWENLTRSIELGDAALARNANEIVALLSTAPKARDPDKYYAAPVPSIVDELARCD